MLDPKLRLQNFLRPSLSKAASADPDYLTPYTNLLPRFRCRQLEKGVKFEPQRPHRSFD
jgi:hypothetical protein